MTDDEAKFALEAVSRLQGSVDVDALAGRLLAAGVKEPEIRVVEKVRNEVARLLDGAAASIAPDQARRPFVMLAMLEIALLNIRDIAIPLYYELQKYRQEK